ncbi:MAG: ABC transporter permease, partial [Candidatus Bathyarchaeia archaeon]
VVYPSSIVPEKWQILYGINPMTGVVEGFRWALFGIGKGPSTMILVSSLIAILLFISGMIWFNYKEQTIADEMGS